MTHPGQKVTRADVARLAGVSPSVVSFALNGGPARVAPATVERVKAAVAELGYIPNAAARALGRGASDAIGLLVRDLADPSTQAVVAEVVRAAQERGLSLTLASTLGDDDAAMTHLRRLDAQRLLGIVVAAAVGLAASDELVALATPIVRIGSAAPPTADEGWMAKAAGAAVTTLVEGAGASQPS